MSDARAVLVVDGDGMAIATFREWDEAHEWAHLRAREGAGPLPIRVEDLTRRRTLDVYAGRCLLTEWYAALRFDQCLRRGAGGWPASDGPS